MKAEPTRQLTLLDLQMLDTRVSQLRHARATVPILAQIAGLEAKAQVIDDEIVRQQVIVDDVQREVTKAEADVQLVRDRAARDQARLDSGTGSAKDLQALQSELESLAKRQADLEDVELEVMERAEAAEHDLSALTNGRGTLGDRITALHADADAALADLDRQLADALAPRPELVVQVGQDLVDLYDKIAATSGTGAAALHARRCMGCQLELNTVELDRIKAAPADEVLRCEECRRILVRTAESGL
ncbi:MAG: zinc ribbon domain-containing protein [Nostocoides sp.]